MNRQTAHVLERHLLLELRPALDEGWERLELERCGGRVRLVCTGQNYHYSLEPTASVLMGVTRALQRATAPGRRDGADVIVGEAGWRALETLCGASLVAGINT